MLLDIQKKSAAFESKQLELAKPCVYNNVPKTSYVLSTLVSNTDFVEKSKKRTMFIHFVHNIIFIYFCCLVLCEALPLPCLGSFF